MITHSKRFGVLLAISACLSWPADAQVLKLDADCLVVGDLYRQAVKIRESGMKRDTAIAMSKQENGRKALEHVYANATMSGDQWAWFMIGVCTGSNSKQTDPAPSNKRIIQVSHE